jgi:molybdopterin-synthase adenylyltransferase
MLNTRFDRNIWFFGRHGQERLLATNVCVVGAGGVGGHVIQQLAFLGVASITIVDPEELDATNRNRYIGSELRDPIPGTSKVDIAERLINRIDPKIRVHKVPVSLRTQAAYQAVIESDFVFGCVDTEGIRLLLAELCAAYDKPFIDISSDTDSEGMLRFGGRVCFSSGGTGCLLCLGQIDAAEAGLDLHNAPAKLERDKIYGVNKGDLGDKGPSVVSINGVVASLAVTEFMTYITQLRAPIQLTIYRGHLGKVLVSNDEPKPNCFICRGIRGTGNAANLQEFIEGEQAE